MRIELNEKLNEKRTFWHNILPIGKFVDSRYGTVQITKELCKEIEKNYKHGIPHFEPPLLLSHDDTEGAYGRVVDLEVREDGLWALIELTDEGRKLIEDEKFNYLSAGYVEDYVGKDGKNVGAVLIEVSLTNTPAHPDMNRIRFSEALLKKLSEVVESMNEKEKIELYIPPVVNEPRQETGKWDWDWAKDANEIIDKLGWAGLAKACAYVDVKNYEKGESGYPENKSAYKLPHHKLKGNKLVLDRAGVITAMGALLGARGGVDIPKSDKRKVYDHLARHYKAFDMEPPEFHYSENGGGKKEMSEEVEKVKETKEAKKTNAKENKTEKIDLAERVKVLEEQNERLTKELSEYKNKVKELEKKLLNEQVEKWSSEWIRKGIMPSVIEKIKSVVLKEPEMMKKFDEIFEELKKPSIFQKYGSAEAKVDLKETAEKIVKSIYGGE